MYQGVKRIRVQAIPRAFASGRWRHYRESDYHGNLTMPLAATRCLKRKKTTDARSSSFPKFP
jgi:hypothetical protein